MKEIIEKELGQKINIIKEDESFLLFECEDGILRSNKIVNGNHKKNSIRVW